MKKRLERVKEQYAKELGYKDWVQCINDQPNYKVESLLDEVAKRLSKKLLEALKT